MAARYTITRKEENYCRLAVLIVKGCTRVMRSLFVRHVELSTPNGHPHSPWTVDEFLLANKIDICKELGKEKGRLPGIKENILFPSQGATDLDKWDIGLLSTILLDVCNYEKQQPVGMYLSKMKRLRNSLCHRGDASITNDDFEIYFDQLKICMEKCCTFLGDKSYTDEIRTLVCNVKHSTLSLEESSRLLKEWYDSDKNIEERLEQHSIELKAVDSKVETLTGKFEILCDILSKSGIKIDMPDTSMEISIKNSGEEEERLLSEKLVQMIDPKLRDDPKLKAELSDSSYQIIYQHVQEAMKELLSNDRELLDVSSKCVIVSIRCSNYGSFKKLLFQSTSGELTDLFKSVERAIRSIEGFEFVALEVFITDEYYWKTMDKLVTNILTAFGFTQEQRRIIEYPEREIDESVTDQSIRDVAILSPEECEERTGKKHEGTCIYINIKPRSIGHYVRIVEKSTPESMNVALRNLTVLLKEYYQLKDLTIEAQSIKTKTDPPDIGHDYLGPEMETSGREEGSSVLEQPRYMGEKMKSTVLKPTDELHVSESAFFERVEQPTYTETSQAQTYSRDHTEHVYPDESSYLQTDMTSKGMEQVINPKMQEMALYERGKGKEYTESSLKKKYRKGSTVPPTSKQKARVEMTGPDGDTVDKTSLSGEKKVNVTGRTEKVKIREKADTNECWAYGLCSLPDGGWLVTDNWNGVLKRLDQSGNVIERFPMHGDPIDVIYVKEHNVAAVTMEKNIELISLGGDKMMRLRTIRTDHHCFGLTFAQEKIFVTSWMQQIFEYNYRHSKRRIVRTISQNTFSETHDISSSNDGSKLFMTDWNGFLFIIDPITTNVIQHIYIGVLPCGVCLGKDDELFVATPRDGIIHFDRHGTKLGTAVTWEMMEGRRPWCVSYDKRTGKLAVSVRGGCDHMFLFNMI